MLDQKLAVKDALKDADWRDREKQGLHYSFNMDNLKLLNVLEITSLCESDHDIGILSDSCGDEDFEGGEGQMDSDEVDDVVENDKHEEEEDN